MPRRSPASPLQRVEGPTTAQGLVAEHGGSACLNCGEPLLGDFCHRCGQKDRDPNPTVGELIASLMDAALNWDARLYRTLRALVSRPGLITATHNRGERARWVPPMRLYVVTSVMFLTVAALAGEAAIARLPADTRSAFDLQNAWAWLTRSFGWAMFLLVPAFAGMLRLAYLRSEFRYVHHLVLAVHYHTLVFLIFTPVLLFAYLAPGTWVALVAGGMVLWATTWLVLSLRRAFGSGWLGATLKATVVLWVYLTAVVPLGSIPVALVLGAFLGTRPDA